MANEFFASPNGTAAGNGSIGNPWDLQTALSHPVALQAGDTLWLRGGTYAGPFVSNITGSPSDRILVAQYPYERATIADNRRFAGGATLQIDGANAIYRDFEVTNTVTDRSSTGVGSFRPMGLQVEGANNLILNLVIHDTGHGVGCWATAQGSEVSGCLIYNCGTANAPGLYSTHGHGIYAQNDVGTKVLSDNIIFNQFGFGIHLYPNPGPVKNFTVSGNILFHNGILTNDTVRYNNILANAYPPYALSNVRIFDNQTYDKISSFDYSSPFQADVYVGSVDVQGTGGFMNNNTLMGNGRTGLVHVNWADAFVTENTLFHRGGLVGLGTPNGTPVANHVWGSNIYYGGGNANGFSVDANSGLSFQSWQSTTGIDGTSAFDPASPVGVQVMYHPSLYTPGRAHVAVYDWSHTGQVNLSLVVAGLSIGDAYEVRDAQNFYAPPLATGIYDSTNLSVDVSLNGLQTVAPVGLSALPHTAPEFAALVILRPGLPVAVDPIAESGLELLLSPNPCAAALQVQLTLPAPGPLRFKIYALTGQLLRTEEMVGNRGGNTLLLNTSDLAAGSYILEVTGKGRGARRLFQHL